MDAYICPKLPIQYKLDKDLIFLISDANQKYGEYRSLLQTFKFDPKFFLNSILLMESLKSTQIEGTQISQDEMYYLKYKKETDESKEIKNLQEAINFFNEAIQNSKKIDLLLVNQLHKILLNSVRGSEKIPGNIRATQNWIGPSGVGIEQASFIPPIPEDVPILLDNLFNYMNDKFIDPKFINLAISHAQFETIHPYKDGNGRLGRTLIPIQYSILTDDVPCLFLSEIIELYKPTYYRTLNESRQGNIEGFIKFFLQCIIDQCNNYIAKIKRINKIYDQDLKLIETLHGTLVYKAMPYITKMVVFTKQELIKELNCHRNSADLLIEKLLKSNIISEVIVNDKKTYQYTSIYNIFVGID